MILSALDPAFTARIATAAPGPFWTMATLAAGAFALATYHAYRAFAHQRLIEDTPTTRLRSAAQGFVELAGTARTFDGEPILAPLSGISCCWFRYAIEERDRGRERGWQRIDGGTSSAIFMLDDAGAACAVDPEGARVTPSFRRTWYGNELPHASLLPRANVFGGLFGARYRFTEERIDHGAPLLALGHLQTHGGAAPGTAATEARDLLRAWKADRTTLLGRFDRDGDSTIDATEWDAAREAALAEATTSRLGNPLPPSVDLLMRPQGGTRPYLLAALPEALVLRRQRRLGLAWTTAALGLAAGLVELLAARF